MKVLITLLLVNLFILPLFILADDPLQEFKVKRKDIFEFTQKPELKAETNGATISFVVKDFCDVTIAVENSEGKILRHLASGVLGAKAPEPFKKDSLAQSITWDGKDDQGVYADKNATKIRVSLGLQAEYEKDIDYSPYKQLSTLPIIATSPEGIFVQDSQGCDHVRLYKHDGTYEKTIYPFPSSQLPNVKGLNKIKSPDGNHEVLGKESLYKGTLLTSGDNDGSGGPGGAMQGRAASSMAVKGKRIALINEHLNRLTADGNTGDLPLKGGKTSEVFDIVFHVDNQVEGSFIDRPQLLGPSSSAFSPDGKTLYMTGLIWTASIGGVLDGSVHGVFKLNYESNENMSIFAGVNSKKEFGSDDTHFTTPTSVDVDAIGNVYVSDFMNDRVQIFEPSGKLLKSLSVKKPAKVLVHQKTGEIYVFSWSAFGIPVEVLKKTGYDRTKLTEKVFIFSPYPEMKNKLEENFSLGYFRSWDNKGQSFEVALDSWTENPTFWIVGSWGRTGIRIVQFKNNKWEDLESFKEKTKKDNALSTAPNQKLFYNPKSEKLYVQGVLNNSSSSFIEMDPLTDQKKYFNIPGVLADDIDFDLDGLIYVRTQEFLSRYQMAPWHEIPFDYGQERSDGLVSVIMLPSTATCHNYQSGMNVNINGDIAVNCHYQSSITKRASYNPIQFPGRHEDSNSGMIHIWDKYGKLKSADVVPGAYRADGNFIDKDNNIYMMVAMNRLIGGKNLLGDETGSTITLVKFKKDMKGKFLTMGGGQLPLSPAEFPKRPLDIRGQWAENMAWIYGGVGFNGDPGGCSCWFSRFKLDYFARSIVPPPMM